MLFDCLTYRPKDVPKVSHYIPVPRKLDYMCFDHHQIRKFMVLLRKRLERKGFNVKENLRFFLSTEYGTDEHRSHRPHVHILFYVYKNCVPYDVLSCEIAACWPYGLTDGIPYKGRWYVQDRCVIKSGLASSVRVCKYVSKYVQKDSTFQKEIDKRINRYLWHHFNNDVRYSIAARDFDTGRVCKITKDIDLDQFSNWCKSPAGKKCRADISRLLSQFHRQSLGYGLAAINDIDVSQLVKTGVVSCPDADKIVMRLALPTYFKRKLFYETTIYKGAKMWQLTEKGKKFMNERKIHLLKYLEKSYRAQALNAHIQFDAAELARYVVYQRGRLQGIASEVTIDDKKCLPDNIYNYVTPSDFKQYHQKGVTGSWLGYSDNYLFSSASFTPIGAFIRKMVYLDPSKEAILDQLRQSSARLGEKKQEFYEHTQQLKSLYKSLFPSTRVKARWMRSAA